MKAYEKIWAEIVDLRNEAIMSDDEILFSQTEGDYIEDGGEY